MTYLLKQYRIWWALLLATLTALVVAGAMAGSAAASHYSWVYNQRASSVCLSWYAGYNGYCRTNMPNGTKFAMICWTDRYGFTGNYYSVRWFYGQAFNTGSYGWVHASYVYYQKSVPRC